MAAKCNPGWVYGCHDVIGYGGKKQNVCGCIEPSKKTSSPAPKPKPKQTTSSNPPVVRNNKPLQSRFEGVKIPQKQTTRPPPDPPKPANRNNGNTSFQLPKINIPGMGDVSDYLIPAGAVLALVIIILIIR